jgi:hypothetical protein
MLLLSKGTNHGVMQANFLEIKEAKYSSNFPFYTHGSKKNEKTGNAVVTHTNTKMFTLVDDSSVFTAALLGILKALKLKVDTIDRGNILTLKTRFTIYERRMR